MNNKKKLNTRNLSIDTDGANADNELIYSKNARNSNASFDENNE